MPCLIYVEEKVYELILEAISYGTTPSAHRALSGLKAAPRLKYQNVNIHFVPLFFEKYSPDNCGMDMPRMEQTIEMRFGVLCNRHRVYRNVLKV